MDLFKYWLDKKKESKWVKLALTDGSYREKPDVPQDYPVNTELATYGDAIIKFCYAEILFEKDCRELSEKIKVFITDERFVTVIAKHYEILKPGLIDYDDDDPNIKKHFSDYSYEKPRKTAGKVKKKSPDKRKATVVEAMIGAIYKETHDLEEITKLLDAWRQL